MNIIVHGALFSGPSQQCSNIVTGDHAVTFAHTRDQRRLTFTGGFDIYTGTVVFNQLSLALLAVLHSLKYFLRLALSCSVSLVLVCATRF